MDTKALLYGLIGFFLGGLLVSLVATYHPEATEPAQQNMSVGQSNAVR